MNTLATSRGLTIMADRKAAPAAEKARSSILSCVSESEPMCGRDIGEMIFRINISYAVGLGFWFFLAGKERERFVASI